MRLGAFFPPWGSTATPEDFDRVAEAVESMGYESLWTGDHVVFPVEVASRYPYNATGQFPFDREEPLYEPLTLLSYLAARTSQVRLGTSVLVLPMRNPVMAAKALADIDSLARGRLQVGIGVGWMREEFDALGADFDARGEIADEWVAVLRRLWTEPASSFEGRYYRFQRLTLNPRPARPIPVLVGGNSRAAMQRAARLGDGWHGVRLDVDEIRRRVEWLEGRLSQDGRQRLGFRIVLRTSLDWMHAAAALEAYARAGVDELVVEVPEADTRERLQVLARVRSSWEHS
jgi:probable F420-dependent oxidoreductase